MTSAVESEFPVLVIVDIRMPPTITDDGLGPAQAVRARHSAWAHPCCPTTSSRATACVSSKTTPEGGGVGSLLEEKVFGVAVLIEALRRIADDETVVDPSIVSRLVGRHRRQDPLDRLTERQRGALGLIAEGLANAAIARRPSITERTVQAHTTQVFSKLGLQADADSHRRVLAVAASLQQGRTPSP